MNHVDSPGHKYLDEVLVLNRGVKEDIFARGSYRRPAKGQKSIQKIVLMAFFSTSKQLCQFKVFEHFRPLISIILHYILFAVVGNDAQLHLQSNKATKYNGFHGNTAKCVFLCLK